MTMTMRRTIVSRRRRMRMPVSSSAWASTTGESSIADTTAFRSREELWFPSVSLVNRAAAGRYDSVRLSNRASVDVLAQESDVVLAALVGGLADHGCAGCLDDR